MNFPQRTARGLRALLPWPAARAELVRHSPIALDASALERLAFGKLALRAGRGLRAGTRGAERADLLVLALANVRAGVLSLTAARRVASTSEHAVGSRPSEPLELDLDTIVGRTSEGDISAGPDQVRRDLELLLLHGERLLGELEEPAKRARAARLREWVRAVTPLLALVMMMSFVGWRLFRARDVSAGKPWATSSIGAVCDPAHKLCGGVKTSIFFHTLEEPEPWFEIDLGTVHELKRVEVHNRTDCCAERAVPLVVEVSLDHEHYRTVARKFTTFDRWQQSFPATQARYVRLRVARRSILHLEQVLIFGRRLG